jgi:Tfp pilus assembly protein PilV
MPAARGFSLIETVLAIGLVIGALVIFAQALAAGVHTTAAARYRTLATLVAQQNIERLRSEASVADGAQVEHFDAGGQVVCAGVEACPAAMLTARWSVKALARAPSSIVIEMEVGHAHRHHGLVRAVAIRPRSIR